MSTAAPERQYEHQYRPPSPYRAAITTALVLALVVAAALGLQAWQRWTQRAPYGPEAVHAHVTMRLVPEAQAQAALDALTGTPGSLEAVRGAGPLLVGQIEYDVPPQARDTDVVWLFLLDAQSGQPLRSWGSAPGGDVGQGWDSSFDQLGRQVPWLAGITGTTEPDGTLSGSAQIVGWGAQVRGPVTFEAVPTEGMLDPAAPSSYTVGITLQKDDRTLVWAEQLTPTAS